MLGGTSKISFSDRHSRSVDSTTTTKSTAPLYGNFTSELKGSCSLCSFCKSRAEFAKTFLRVVKTPVYSFSVHTRKKDSLAIKGFVVFLPKYLYTHFGIVQYK